MSKEFARNVVFIFSPFILAACFEIGKVTPDVQELPPPSLKHDAKQCPELTGIYTRDDQDNGETVEEEMKLQLEMKDGILIFSSGEKAEPQIVDGQSHHRETEPLDYQIGCDEGILVVQDLIVNKPLGQIKYILNGGNLTMKTKSFDESIMKFGADEIQWKRKEPK